MGYKTHDIRIVCGFDVARNKVERPLSEAIYAKQNIFNKNNNISKKSIKEIANGMVYKGKILDGISEEYLHILENKVCSDSTLDVSEILKENNVDVVINLLPTGALNASRFYCEEALKAKVSFLNCIPSLIFRDNDIRRKFLDISLPILGDDIKSQLGTTIIHRSILNAIKLRGGEIENTTQINMGGNMDFFNLDSRYKTKIESKKYSLSIFCNPEKVFVKNIFNPLKGPLKYASIDVLARVFGDSPLDIKITFTSDDKANASGCIVDLVRFSKALLEDKIEINYETLNLISSFYMKSPDKQEDENDAFKKLTEIIS